jgi:hypothetical protein
MMEYNTALVLIFLTYIVSIINIKMYIVGLLMVIIDILIMLPEPLSTGQVVVGYLNVGSVLTPLTQVYPWIRVIGVIGILLCSVTIIMKMLGVFDGI